jgi:hypothetical protein
MMQTLQLTMGDAERGLGVQPDVLWVPLAIRVEDVPSIPAVDCLRAAAELLHQRLATLHAGARLIPWRLDLGDGASDKSARSDSGDVQLDGAATVPLDVESPFWARAGLAAHVVTALREVARTLAKSKPAVRVGWRSPVGRVSDVEAHRTAVAERYNAFYRVLWEGLSTSAVEVETREIEQVPVSLEEVRLVLAPGRPAGRRG